jgi:hypothetical protein
MLIYQRVNDLFHGKSQSKMDEHGELFIYEKMFFSSMFAIKSHSHPFPKGLAVSRVETGWRFHQVDIAGIPFESFFVQGKTPVRPSASVRKMRPPEPPGNLY